MSDALRAALDHVREHGFGDNVDADEIIENLAQDYLAQRDREPWCNHDAVAVHNGRCECGAEVWYCWRQRVDTDDGQRLIVPESDPMIYEHPYNLLFATIEEARADLDEHFEDMDVPTDWVLCKETLEVVR